MLTVFILGLANRAVLAQLFTVTPHELLPEEKIIVEEADAPEWKALWDEARQSALQGEFEKALQQYRALLELKSNLAEARWELARLMMYLKYWDQAAEVLELLIESEPESILYINALGKVMLEMQQYERAVALFQRVHKQNQTDQTALVGLVEGLTKLKRVNEALPYLEQLSRQEPTNRGVRRYLALLLYENGNYEKARMHFTILSRNEDVEIEVLEKTAETYGRLGLDQQASIYWERVLAREYENIAAHSFLAKYYEESGLLDRALSHLQAILVYSPEDTAPYERLGEIYEKAGDYHKALTNYEKYLGNNPQDEKISQRVVRINAVLAGERQTHESSRQDSAAGAEEKSETLTSSIRQIMETGRYEDAIPLYRQLILAAPEDQVILANLADDLIAINDNVGQKAMVEFLEEIALDNLSLYRSMAEILRHEALREELLAVLQRIHELDPEDSFTTQELAILSLDSGELLQSSKYFAELSDLDCWNVQCLEARAKLAEKLDLPLRRIRDYESLLELQAGRYDIRLKLINLGAQMGLLDTTLFHAGYLQILPQYNENYELKILLADAYRESGYSSRAVTRYRNVLEQTSGQDEAAIGDFRIRSWLGIVETYKQLGMMYEAEETLRKALVSERNKIPILEDLFHLYLETGRMAESEIWLDEIERSYVKTGQDLPYQAPRDWKKEFFQAEMYQAEGDFDLAIDLYRQAEELLSESDANREGILNNPESEAPNFRIQRHLIVCLLQTGEYAAAEGIVHAMEFGFHEELERLVLLEQVYLAWGKDVEAEIISEKAGEYAGQDFGRQLALAQLYRKYNKTLQQLGVAKKAANQQPESLSALRLMVDAQIKEGELIAAIEVLNRFLRSYPENTWFLSQQAELLAQVGNFQEALGFIDIILSEQKDRWDIVLLKSRILWELNRWKDSVSLYESVLVPSVNELVDEDIEDMRLSVDRPQDKGSWWDAITFSEGAPLPISEVIMAPHHAVDFSENGQAANSVAAEYYALFRWQDRFSKELTVRRFVLRRDYYHAAKKLEKVIEDYGSNDFLVYDLAGLYSKLEQLGDEAALYRQLEAKNAYFPGLTEALQRNNLKRRPRIQLAYNMLYDDGWDGYKSVQQNMLGMSGKYYQATNQEWKLDVTRINYESTRDTQNVWGWRAFLNYNVKVSQALSLSLGGGVEKLEEPYDDTPLLYGAIIGKIADEMKAVLSVKQDVVADTIASLKRNIIKQDYKIELMFDLFPRLLLGGYYDFRDYSDNNWTNYYTFWASYIILPEPNILKITYNYDFSDSREGQIPGDPSDDGFAPDDHPYWSPLNYWITRFSLYFKHQFSNDTLARGVPSNFILEYSLGYDAYDNDLHELKGSVNIEVAKNFTLSASYGYLDLDVYQHKEALMSVMYRF